jgi:transcriptional regulator with XRE-family HTH domain
MRTSVLTYVEGFFMSKCFQPDWTKEAKKMLVDKEMNQAQLADAINLNRNYVRQLLSGSRQSKPAEIIICRYLGLLSDTKM